MIIKTSITILGIVFLAFHVCATAAPPKKRSCKICVSNQAPPALQQIAKRIVANAKNHATLKVMSDRKPAELVHSEELLQQPWEQRAFTHLVVIGLPDDKLVRQVWQNEADIDSDTIYVHGVGYLQGDIGFIESERNPFLYSPQVRQAPYTAMVITITGTTLKGLRLAADAFLKQGLTNGVIAADGWNRPEPTILDAEPLRPAFEVPGLVSNRIGGWQLVGLTRCPEPDYRGVLAVSGSEPMEMWRAKYYRPGEWDLPGAKNSFLSYSNSLHRRAYGNSLLVMHFPDEKTARQAASRIAGNAGLRKRQQHRFTGVQPIFSSKGFRDPGNPDIKTWKAPFSVWPTGSWVCFSSLPHETNHLVR